MVSVTLLYMYYISRHTQIYHTMHCLVCLTRLNWLHVKSLLRKLFWNAQVLNSLVFLHFFPSYIMCLEKFFLYITAIIDLNGRYFGGRIVKACFYNLDKFRRLDLGGEIDSSWQPWKRKFFQLVFIHKCTCTSIVCTFINEMAQRSTEIIGILKH